MLLRDFFIFALPGPTFAPEKYKVKVIKGSKSYETEIELILDPDSPHSESDRKIRYETLMKAYNLLEHLAFVDKQITDIIEQTKEHKSKVSKKDTKKIQLLIDKVDKLHKILTATKKGHITGEEKLREKLGELYGFILFYRGRPTNSQIDGLNLFEKELKNIEEELKSLTEKDLVQINKILTKENLKEIKLISKEEFFKEDNN